MSEDLRQLVGRVRAGDREAIAEFVGQFGERIRGVARQRIARLRIAGEVEPDEILNTAMLELCRRAAQVEAQEPEELVGYLERIVRSETSAAWRRVRLQKRHHGRSDGGSRCGSDGGSEGGSAWDIPDTRSAPHEELELVDTMGRIYELLSGPERVISLLRRAGMSWSEIARRTATTANTARKRWERAVNRALRDL